MMRPTLPIIVAEGLDVFFFTSVRAVELGLEANDVNDGIYQGYDADGRRLLFTAVKSGDVGGVRVGLAEELPEHKRELRALLIEFLESFASSNRMEIAEGLQESSLPQLIQRARQIAPSE